MNKDILLVFDFDGTIADSTESMDKIFNKLVLELGSKRKIELKKLRHLSSRELIKEFNIPLQKLPFLMLRTREELGKEIPSLKPVLGMPEAIKALHKKGIKMSIISSNSKENIKKFLENNKLNYFEFIIGGGSLFGKDKQITKFVKDQKLSKNKLIFCGDETRDIEAARNAEVKIISVCWGYNSKELLKKHNPDWIIKKPEELLRI